jgi:hypothetical protein
VGAAAVLQFVRTGKLRCIATGTPKFSHSVQSGIVLSI